MANTLSLVVSGSAAKSLNDSVHYGLKSYRIKTSPDGEDVEDTVVVDVLGTSNDDLAANVRKLEGIAEYARQFAASKGKNFVYLAYQPGTMTNTSYAMVRSIEVILPDDTMDGSSVAGNMFENVTLKIKREGWWRGAIPGEGVSYSKTTLESDYAGTVIYADYTSDSSEDVEGTAPALPYFSAAMGSNYDFHRIVVGIRSDHVHPALTSFQYIWECESAPAGTRDADTAAIDDAAYSGGHALSTSFAASAALIRRYYIRLEDVLGGAPTNAQCHANVGRYRVWLRCWLTAGSSSCTVKLKYGAADTAYDILAGNLQTVTHTAAHWIDCGIVAMPPPGFMTSETIENEMTNAYLSLYASRASGAAALVTDCFAMVPVDECYFDFSATPELVDAGVYGSGFNTYGPYGLAMWTQRAAGATSITLKGDPILPLGDGRAVIIPMVYNAGFWEAADVAGETSNIPIGFVQRYRSVRGLV